MSEQKHPVSDWKSRRLKVGHHLRNKKGEIGVVEWVSRGCLMYRLGSRFTDQKTENKALKH